MDEEVKTNILIVDDRADKLTVLSSILEGLGQNLVLARSGREALRRVLEGEYAVILLDVHMPDMDGFETAALIRQRKQSAQTPIIFVTAYVDDMRASQGYSLGAVDYIYSPVVPDVLRTKVGVFVDLYRKTEQVKRQAEERVALAREQALRVAAEEATRRSALLAEASAVLGRSLDFEATLPSLCRLMTPLLADVACVAVAGSPGQPWRGQCACAGDGGEVQTFALCGSALPDDELRRAFEGVLQSGRPATLEGIDVPCPPGGGCAGRLNTAVVLPLLARGRALGALGLAHGSSRRRFSSGDVALAEDVAGRAAVAVDNARLVHELREADRLKNEFLAMLAHELRNPLAPIRNAVEVLRLRGATPAQLDWARGVVERQVLHMVRLVDDLLDVSRITRGKIRLQREPLDLMSVLSRAIETSRPLIQERGHELTVTPAPGPLWSNGDPVRLAQVLSNLLNNAAKFTEKGGKIRLMAAEENGQAILRVRDTGVGIPAEMLGNVFDLFTQVDRSLDRSVGGLGIGLTLVRQLVEMHGGSVEARSDGPGKGSEFIVRLPLTAEAPAPPAVPGPAAPPVPHGPARRILIIDDNKDAAESLRTLLALAGHEVQVAHDGPAGLAAVETFGPEVVLLDIGLPGMDGYEVCRRLRALPDGQHILLAATTGYDRAEDRGRARAAGFDCHLVKPVDLDELGRWLARSDAAGKQVDPSHNGAVSAARAPLP
jgi:signal transduction histidine kinase/DNA-binding response OmpR family regulator